MKKNHTCLYNFLLFAELFHVCISFLIWFYHNSEVGIINPSPWMKLMPWGRAGTDPGLTF